MCRAQLDLRAFPSLTTESRAMGNVAKILSSMEAKLTWFTVKFMKQHGEVVVIR